MVGFVGVISLISTSAIKFHVMLYLTEFEVLPAPKWAPGTQCFIIWY